jgi:hypothetical protein
MIPASNASKFATHLTVISAIAASSLAGCAASGVQVSQEAALQFKEGVSTETEIIARLGKPTTVVISNGVKMLSYSGMQYKTKGATFIPIVGLFAGGADYAYSNVTYQVAANGVLEKVTYTSSGSGSRMGQNPAEMSATDPSAVK